MAVVLRQPTYVHSSSINAQALYRTCVRVVNVPLILLAASETIMDALTQAQTFANTTVPAM